MDVDLQAFGAALTARLETHMSIEAATAAVRAAETAHDAAVHAARAGHDVSTRETFEAWAEASRVLVVVTRRCAAIDQDAIFALRRQMRDTRDPAERDRVKAAHDAAVRAYDLAYLIRQAP